MVKSKFTPTEKAAIVMESITTNISTAELCRKHNVSPNTFYPWREKFLESGKTAFVTGADANPCKHVQRENDSLKRLIGELTIANDVLKKTLHGVKR